MLLAFDNSQGASILDKQVSLEVAGEISIWYVVYGTPPDFEEVADFENINLTSVNYDFPFLKLRGGKR